MDKKLREIMDLTRKSREAAKQLEQLEQLTKRVAEYQKIIEGTPHAPDDPECQCLHCQISRLAQALDLDSRVQHTLLSLRAMEHELDSECPCNECVEFNAYRDGIREA